ncbi:sulfoxide reductase heme-binding subunit YedZ [Verticiella sediminum]|uniref:Protein-methionine-sulfoxide reductase heme-binding subunit MsrQ n=1 Tax=Verticiella sediminum TaxID=1247510 RepID=A0A556A8C7_9BURK|nr:protein-methionine-sulfoxide reductase heme-binding subunit MsrQ [Verticiella sediminum]TSH89144.1 sulfoxide reductase heme-binding subunit YedZ [Verticiella sediminum]
MGPLPVPAAKVLLFCLGLVPLARWVWLGVNGGLTANPQEFLLRSAGTWTFVCLLVTLAISPLRVWLRQPGLIRLRRMCGLFAFFYACLHFLAYAGWDQGFDVPFILADIAERPFIAFGFVAFVLLIALAATSPQAAMRRLGRHWQRLHRAIYAIGILAIVHLYLHKAGKNDFQDVWWFGGVLAALLAWRIWRRYRVNPPPTR